MKKPSRNNNATTVECCMLPGNKNNIESQIQCQYIFAKFLFYKLVLYTMMASGHTTQRISIDTTLILQKMAQYICVRELKVAAM